MVEELPPYLHAHSHKLSPDREHLDDKACVYVNAMTKRNNTESFSPSEWHVVSGYVNGHVSRIEKLSVGNNYISVVIDINHEMSFCRNTAWSSFLLSSILVFTSDETVATSSVMPWRVMQ